MRSLLGVVVGLAVALAAPSARAVEREHHIGIGTGLSLLKIGDKDTMDVGAGVTGFYTYGITDQFNLLIEGGTSLVALGEQRDAKDTPPTRPTTVSHAAAGVAYVLDVLQWVPYAGVLGGGTYFAGGTVAGGLVLPDAQIALGLDYKFSRRVAFGVALRQHLFLTKMDTYPTFTNIFAKVEYSWGW